MIGATWDEIDLDGATWMIPAARMKGGAEHVVPLSEPAVALLRASYAVRMSRFVFPGRRPDKPLSHSALAETLRRLGVDPSRGHGARLPIGFRDWCGDETEFGRDVAEAALAHRGRRCRGAEPIGGDPRCRSGRG